MKQLQLDNYSHTMMFAHLPEQVVIETDYITIAMT